MEAISSIFPRTKYLSKVPNLLQRQYLRTNPWDSGLALCITSELSCSDRSSYRYQAQLEVSWQNVHLTPTSLTSLGILKEHLLEHFGN